MCVILVRPSLSLSASSLLRLPLREDGERERRRKEEERGKRKARPGRDVLGPNSVVVAVVVRILWRIGKKASKFMIIFLVPSSLLEEKRRKHLVCLRNFQGNKRTSHSVTYRKEWAKWYQPKVGRRSIDVHLHCLFTFSAANWVYWRNPVQSGIIFGVCLSMIITFMFLSALAAVSFWSLAFLILSGLYKLYTYLMATFVGRVQDDVLEYGEEKPCWEGIIWTAEAFLGRSFHLMCISPNDKPKRWRTRFERMERLFWNKDAVSSSGIIWPVQLWYDLSSLTRLKIALFALVRSCSVRLLLHWSVDECIDIRPDQSRSGLYDSKDLSSLSGQRDIAQSIIDSDRLLFLGPNRSCSETSSRSNQSTIGEVSFIVYRSSRWNASRDCFRRVTSKLPSKAKQS